MPIENPDIIQLGSLIRDESQLGASNFITQTGMDISGDEQPLPGSSTNVQSPPPPGTINANEAEKKRVQLGIVAFVGGIISGVFIGSILTMGRKR